MRERRRAIRRSTPAGHRIVLARVRPGRDADVLDISATGALIETAHRLLPGALVDVQLHTAERRTSVRGRVLRCSVAFLSATRVWYRGAIDFDDHLLWLVDDIVVSRQQP